MGVLKSFGGVMGCGFCNQVELRRVLAGVQGSSWSVGREFTGVERV